MIGVAIPMNGGPGSVWGPRALAAYHEFADTRLSRPVADDPTPVRQWAPRAGVNVQSRCLIPLMKDDRSRSGSPSPRCRAAARRVGGT